MGTRLAKAISSTRNRWMESLRLFRPQEHQMPFFLTRAPNRVIRGGNRSGKSLCSAAFFASVATGIPLTGFDETIIPAQFPTDRPLTLWVVGYGERHISSPIYPLLFKAGAFKIIKDARTGEWRTFNPRIDAARVLEAKDAPPLIPPRFIASRAWVSKATWQFEVMTLKNGNEIRAFTSTGEAKQGDKVDLVWVDEDIAFDTHVAEWQQRLKDRMGVFVWSAKPNIKNFALRKMCDKAIEQMRERPNPNFHETLITQTQNIYISDDAKALSLDELGDDDDQVRSRIYGEFADEALLMYPTFSGLIHCWPSPAGFETTVLEEMLVARGGQPPENWTRYLVLDPGHTRAAVVFAAVPPPDIGDFVYQYDELYPRGFDTHQMAAAVERKIQGYQFEAFIIDAHASRQSLIGIARTMYSVYMEGFEKLSLKSRQTGSGFLMGSDDTASRQDLVRQWLSIRPDGTSRYRLWKPACPNTIREFSRYRKQYDAQGNITDKAAKGYSHLMNGLEYLAAHNPKYRSPDKKSVVGSVAFRAWTNFMAKKKEQTKDTFFMGPAQVKT